MNTTPISIIIKPYVTTYRLTVINECLGNNSRCWNST